MTIKFDKRYELIFGLLYTVGKKNHHDFPWIKEQNKSYEQEFYEMAQKFITHSFEEYILNGGLSYYEGCCQLASAINDNYEIIPTPKINTLDQRQEINIKRLSDWLKEFAKKSHYEEFWQNHHPYYEKVKKELEALLNEKRLSFSKVFSDFYGQQAKPMQIILTNFLWGSFGLELNNTLTFVAGMDLYKNFEFKDSFIQTLFHEYSHPYVNPLGNKYFSTIEIPQMKEEAINNGLDKCYYKEETIANEYVVRAIETYLSKMYLGTQYFHKSLDNHKKRGFIHIEEIFSLLNNKEKYPTFEELYVSELVPYFMNLEENLKKAHQTVQDFNNKEFNMGDVVNSSR